MASDLPKRTDAVGVVCQHCGQKNTVVELYDSTGPEGNCLSCSRSFKPSQEVIRKLSERLPIYRRYLRHR